MRIDEFEKNLLFFVRNSEEKIIHTNIAYYLGLSTKESKQQLERLAEAGTLMLDSDDDGNLFYYMPNVPRKLDEEVLKSYFFGMNKVEDKPVNPNLSVNSNNQARQCPYCMEPIRANAKKCKHCGEIIDVTLLNNNNGIANKKNFPHILHLFLSFFSGGGWVIIWILAYIFRDKDKYT